MPKHSKAEVEEQKANLRDWLKPGDTLYTVLDHVSKSGMSRDISLIILTKDDNGEIITLHPNYAAQVILGYPAARKGDGIRVGGCGMDMGFHVVSTISRILYPDGFDCVGKGCPSNDHSNGDRDYSPHRHRAGDYAIKHRWL